MKAVEWQPVQSALCKLKFWEAFYIHKGCCLGNILVLSAFGTDEKIICRVNLLGFIAIRSRVIRGHEWDPYVSR